MTIFYTPDIETLPVLPEAESQHAVRVLRLTAGSRIQLIDGMGGMYEAEIVNPHPKHCQVQILHHSREHGKRDYRLHIAIAPTKSMERMEFFVEKACEIGIDEITPLICRHSERKEVKTARLEKVAIAAAKQSGKAYIPKINEAQSFDRFIKTVQSEEQKMIACCHQSERVLMQNCLQKRQSALVLIGPEGDFSTEEITWAVEGQGFVPISLGESRLRTETAAIVACHTAAFIHQV